MNIIVSQEIEQVCPGFVGAAVEADVVNSGYCAELWAEIEALGEKYRGEHTTETIKQIPGIEATVAGQTALPNRHACGLNQPCEHRIRLQHRRFRRRQVRRRHADARRRA